MAKSLRSKWKRMMRAIKREKYGVKELAKLEEMVKATRDREALEKSGVKFIDLNQLKTRSAKSVEAIDPTTGKPVEGDAVMGAVETPVAGEAGVEKMELDVETKRNSKTLRDKHGQYPIWMSQRNIEKIKKKSKRLKSKKNK